MFVQRVKEKEAELKEAEKEVMNLNVMWHSYLRTCLLLSEITKYCFVSSPSVAAREVWPFEEAPPGREEETGGEEEVPRWRAQHVQTEKDCCRALAEPSPASRRLHHTQEGQREEKVSVVLFLLCLPFIYPYSLGEGDHFKLCKDRKSLETMKLGGTRPHFTKLTFQDVDHLPDSFMGFVRWIAFNINVTQEGPHCRKISKPLVISLIKFQRLEKSCPQETKNC